MNSHTNRIESYLHLHIITIDGYKRNSIFLCNRLERNVAFCYTFLLEIPKKTNNFRIGNEKSGIKTFILSGKHLIVRITQKKMAVL